MSYRRPINQEELLKLREEIEPLTMAYDLLADHVIITDPDANVVYANIAAIEHTGFSKEEIVGKNPGDLWGGNMGKEFYEEMWRTIKIEKKPFAGEVKNTRKDGTEYWQGIFITPVLDKAGEIRFFIGIEPEITKKKKLDQLRDEFVSIVGHQLRNPLSIILWTLESVLQSGKFSEAEKEVLKEVYKKNQELSGLVTNLLMMSRIEKGNLSDKEEVDLYMEIDKIIKEVKSRNPEVEFSFEKLADKATILANRSLALQAFSNIIYNAAEYSDRENGKVDIAIEIQKEGENYLFSCHNNGPEIPVEDQPQIFSKLFRASNANQMKKSGTGLGLFVVKMITDSFGWDVWFVSKPGEGVTFYIKIPIKHDAYEK